LVNTAHQTKTYFESASKQLKESAPEPNEALKWLRQTATSYASFIPGGKSYVDTAFNDLDAIRAKHGSEVDEIVKSAYTQLRDVTKEKGMSVETAQKAWEIITEHMQKIGELAGDAAEQIMNNHPELKDKVGGNLDKLKELGDKYGPEAKKQADETWKQVEDILKSGVSVTTVNKIRKLVQEKTEQVQKFGDEAWKQGMEQAKPYLDKSPKVKELIEQNADSLKKGNFSETLQKIKQAVESGDTGSFEEYVKSAGDKAKQSVGGSEGLKQYFNMIPGGDKIFPKISQLQEIAEKHGEEAQKIAKEAFDEIQQVLSKKADEAEKLADKAKKDAK